ncbi:Hpt domain-containing protein [Nitrobacter sp.]|uniref:Hpt domain-containing protein n=1 Tax=unclassified Nitrobacter TaxID=2620411 RepID=UPI002C5DDAB1|nr:Hpt domain-containing protein [Nitrobacter sp.]
MQKEDTSELSVQAFADYHVITPPNRLRNAVRLVDEKNFEDPVARAEKALAGLSDEFSTWMAIERDRLVVAHAAILNNGFTPAARDELFRAAHDIKGDAATFGYPAAAAGAESLCRIIEHAPALDRVPAELIAYHINAIQAIVREHTAPGAETMAMEINRKLRLVADEYLAAVNQDRPEHLEAILAPSIAPTE